MSAALECRDVRVAYGRFQAIDGFAYAFREGGLYGIIGPNGAGKTTLMNALVGSQRLTGGSVHLGGRDVTRLKVPARARLGLGRSFQITKIFSGQTVFENLRLAAQVSAFGRQPMWRPAAAFPEIAEAARAMVETIGLDHLADAPADRLSHGDQRALELGLALMPDPRVLLLDEPLAGIGHHAIPGAIELIGRLAKGRTVLLIEHNIEAVMRLAEAVLVMANGRLIADGPPEEVRRDPAVREAYLGSEAA